MCELSVYTLNGDRREKVMEMVIRLTSRDGMVLIEGILGESKEIAGKLKDVDIIAQEASIVVD
jgi:predicted RNA-binding protein